MLPGTSFSSTEIYESNALTGLSKIKSMYVLVIFYFPLVFLFSNTLEWNGDPCFDFWLTDQLSTKSKKQAYLSRVLNDL